MTLKPQLFGKITKVDKIMNQMDIKSQRAISL